MGTVASHGRRKTWKEQPGAPPIAGMWGMDSGRLADHQGGIRAAGGQLAAEAGGTARLWKRA